VFQELQPVVHELGVGQEAFNYRKRTETTIQCQHIFLDHVMTEQQGKIQCTYCKAKLGQFSLSGMQCSCGTWVAPAFAISRSKVDI
jgi:dual specificity phosphatase 12